jgi:hypothetical protein
MRTQADRADGRGVVARAPARGRRGRGGQAAPVALGVVKIFVLAWTGRPRDLGDGLGEGLRLVAGMVGEEDGGARPASVGETGASRGRRRGGPGVDVHVEERGTTIAEG